MTEMIVDTQTVSEMILSKISADKVKFREENGVITLTPCGERKPLTPEEMEECQRAIDRLYGMFAGGKMSVDDFLALKRRDMDLEP